MACASGGLQIDSLAPPPSPSRWIRKSRLPILRPPTDQRLSSLEVRPRQVGIVFWDEHHRTAGRYLVHQGWHVNKVVEERLGQIKVPENLFVLIQRSSPRSASTHTSR